MARNDMDSDMEEPTFVIGDTFDTFENLEEKIKLYEDKNFVKFWKREAKTIVAAKKRVDRHLKPDLKYYQLRYCCINGGQGFRAKGTGARSTSTFKQDCPVHIYVRVNNSGEKLEVISTVMDHNHAVSQELYRHLPQVRKLSKDAQEKAKSLLEMNANKKLVQEAICQDTGNVVLLKDLTNIATATKKKATRNDLDAVVKLLMDKYGACVDVYSDDMKNFKGLFFQDKQMTESFKAYPELLCLDATYKLLDLRLPVYLMLCEDSNGASEIIAVCLLASEDIDSMRWMLEIFKERNDKWNYIRVVMADKDIKERHVIKELLPDTSVLICLFHTLRTFRREITCEKMGITSGQRTTCLDTIQQMAYCSSQEQYDTLYSQFDKTCPKKVVEYFNDNWHTIKDEWVLGFKATSGSFLNMTNNRLESINGKLKQVINRYSSLEEFIVKFFIILTSLRTERDHKAALSCHKVKVQSFPQDSPESKYSTLLTPYAFSFILKQIELAEKVKNIQDTEGIFTVETNDGVKIVAEQSCECVFYKSMRLPCRHIFALRKSLGISIFEPNICEKRWTSEYYKSTQRIFLDFPSTPSVTTVFFSNSKKQRALSQHEKFRKANMITTELAAVISESSQIHFHRRLSLVKKLIEYWKSGEEVALTEIDDAIDMFLSDDDEDNDEEVLTVNKSSSGNNDDSMVASDSISCGKENKRPSETGIKASGDDSFQSILHCIVILTLVLFILS
jgi:zinc finger SWIM domain-containing protein 3